MANRRKGGRVRARGASSVTSQCDMVATREARRQRTGHVTLKVTNVLVSEDSA